MDWSQEKISLFEEDQNLSLPWIKDKDGQISDEDCLFPQKPIIDICVEKKINSQEVSNMEQSQSLKTPKSPSRSYKTSTNYRIIINSILTDFEVKKRQKILSRLQAQFNLSRKSYPMIILLLHKYYPKQKLTQENYEKLSKIIQENLKFYLENSKKGPSYLEELRIQINRLKLTISFYFKGNIDKAIQTCYQAVEKSDNNKGNSQNFLAKCHQIISEYNKKY